MGIFTRGMSRGQIENLIDIKVQSYVDRRINQIFGKYTPEQLNDRNVRNAVGIDKLAKALGYEWVARPILKPGPNGVTSEVVHNWEKVGVCEDCGEIHDEEDEVIKEIIGEGKTQEEAVRNAMASLSKELGVDIQVAELGPKTPKRGRPLGSKNRRQNKA